MNLVIIKILIYDLPNECIQYVTFETTSVAAELSHHEMKPLIIANVSSTNHLSHSFEWIEKMTMILKISRKSKVFFVIKTLKLPGNLWDSGGLVSSFDEYFTLEICDTQRF